jgi:hypothetical protein
MDLKMLESQILTQQNEIQQLKSTFSPCLALLNEILDIRKKRNLSESQNHSLLSMLTVEIKSEILRESNLLFATSNQLSHLNQ